VKKKNRISVMLTLCQFQTTEWSLQMPDGTIHQLLKNNKPDPFQTVNPERELTEGKLA
jgi:hypothetical protein